MPRKTTKVDGARTWAWRRWISVDFQEAWIPRLEAAGCTSWVFTERPLRPRVLLEAYVDSRATANALIKKWGGGIRLVDMRQWLKPRRVPPTKIGNRLEIVHQKGGGKSKAVMPTLYIPHGLAFGSGEHATTFMLLRALIRQKDWSAGTVLDLGTGSGVLALAARLFGAKKIVATDFDPDAVRTARQNEEMNFPRPLVRWRCADVKKLRPTTRYDLVLANLFSGILGEAASQIAGCVLPGGQLWLSGILVPQREEVIAAYCRQGLRLTETIRRGKWVMLQWTRVR